MVEFPYKPLGAPYYEVLADCFEKKRDTFYNHKNEYFDKDVIVSNVLTHPEVVLLNPVLIKELLSVEKMGSIKKHNGPY